MDLEGNNSPIGRFDGRSDAELLTEIRTGVKARQRLTIEEWVAIVAWADQNTVETLEGAATVIAGVIDTGIPLAGDGAPLVSEFNLMELIAVLGRSPDGGRDYVGQVIECAWRLPAVYAGVVAGKIQPFRALRIADLTHTLNAQAAAYVDRHLASAVGGVSWAQTERLVAEAITRCDPERAEVERKKAADARRFDIGGIGGVDEHGLVDINGIMDAADGHDLELAIRHRAEQLGRLGDESSLDVRRSKAVAELARQDLALDLLVHDSETGEITGTVPGRKVVLNVHITDTTITTTTTDPGPFGNPSTDPAVNPVGRWDEGRCPISTEQIREWLTESTATIIVRPVIDLADCIPTTAYEIPDRHRRRVELREHTCRFPHCTKPATRCDLDHQVPYGEGGVTCPCNLVALCRRHHRAKTFSLWRYVTINPGHYLWLSPNGHHWHVGPQGTRALDPPQSIDPDPYDQPDDPGEP